MVTMYDVANAAGLSIGTVSRFINSKGYVSADAEARIREAIAATGYVPSSAARSLTTKRSGLIAFLATELVNPFTAQLAQSMALAAGGHGYSVLTAVTGGDEERTLATLRAVRGQHVDGVVATPPDTPAVRRELENLTAAGTPVVVVGMPISPGADRVSADTYGGARAAVGHLIDAGHERIAFLTGRPAGEYARGRLAGYRDELAARGLAADDDLIVPVDLDRRDIAQATSTLVASATAAFTVNDLLALEVFQQAHKLGIHVPRELSVVGFDDVLLAAAASPALSTVAQPIELMGQQVAQLLLTRMADPTLPSRDIRLGCTLIERDSVAAPRPAAVRREGHIG